MPVQLRMWRRSSSAESILTSDAGDQLRDRRPGEQHEEPDRNELESITKASRLRQQPQHDEPQAEIVRLRQRMQSRERVGKPEQADRAGKKEQRAGGNRDNRHDIERETHRPSIES